MHRGMNRIFMDHSTRIVTQKFENEAHCFSMELIYSDEELSPFLSRSVSDAAAYMGVSLQMAEWRMSTVEPSIWGMYE